MLAKPLKNHSRNYKDQSLDDSTLWLSFKKGNDLAFSVLYNKYVHRLYNYGMHTCRNKELVLDCIQELFALLWDRREKLSEVTCVNYYLFKSFRRLLMNRLTVGRKFLISLSDRDGHGFDFAPSKEDVLIEEEWEVERNKKIRNSLHTLTKRQREAIFLKFFNQLSYHEVAAIMDLHVDSVYNLISKAIDILRKKLKADAVFLILFSLLGL
ncbi:sigma-70 family RNA polymerase sigma factor [Chryseolinea sp. H1M3-3]|uniref:RNA polymerase sigma factor n=1 Tax=Chryseolinea sp. H1M3-3 TaxID=3034144 RepID=UPI0023EAF03E|nr:sigma-70 family RNA polymerase sigma factor [Chryseolinea sp. H1M3-3]